MHSRLLRGLCVLVTTVAVAPQSIKVALASGERALTIFVDEGKGETNGHVFLSLNDGRNTYTLGFYSETGSIASLVALGGGEIRADSGHRWDVRKRYPISEAGYAKAREAITAWRTQDEAWWVDHHCGDFVESVAKEAGIALDLPWHATGRNRPGIFGEYLRNNGGETFEQSRSHTETPPSAASSREVEAPSDPALDAVRASVANNPVFQKLSPKEQESLLRQIVANRPGTESSAPAMEPELAERKPEAPAEPARPPVEPSRPPEKAPAEEQPASAIRAAGGPVIGVIVDLLASDKAEDKELLEFLVGEVEQRRAKSRTDGPSETPPPSPGGSADDFAHADAATESGDASQPGPRPVDTASLTGGQGVQSSGPVDLDAFRRFQRSQDAKAAFRVEGDYAEATRLENLLQAAEAELRESIEEARRLAGERQTVRNAARATQLAAAQQRARDAHRRLREQKQAYQEWVNSHQGSWRGGHGGATPSRSSGGHRSGGMIVGAPQ